LELLGAEPWLANPNSITKEQLSGLYVDTAALSGWQESRGVWSCVGVLCSTEATVEENPQNTLAYEGFTEERDVIGHNVKVLFAEAVKRMKGMGNSDAH
jgi:hypothetical protein